MRKEKPYLDPELTLRDLARILGMNTTHLSQTINKGFGKNFNDFINEYRIEMVKKKLLSGERSNATLLELAFESGFNSKATFNRSFKKFTGKSPREFAAAQSSD